VPTPGAQCQERIEAQIALFVGHDPRAARDAELGLRAVAAGDAPILPPDRALLSIEPCEILLSALKPTDEGEGYVLRVLNPTDATITGRIDFGQPVTRAEAVRLDETPTGASAITTGNALAVAVQPHALQSLRLR